MRSIAIIPARGGSKRLPRKNLIDFHGKPIIVYTIEAATQAGVFDRVVVSSDSKEILAVAANAGVEISLRPDSLATDRATLNDVCLDLLDKEEAAGREYEAICCLYATAPLRNAGDVRAVMALLEPGVCDYAMAVTHFSHPPFQAMRNNSMGFLEEMWPDLGHRRTQDMEELFIDNGSTYAALVKAFRDHKTFRGPRARGYLMPRSRSVDIDVQEDLDMALYFGRKPGL